MTTPRPVPREGGLIVNAHARRGRALVKQALTELGRQAQNRLDEWAVPA